MKRQLALARELDMQHQIVIVGSLALFLHGIRLKRFKTGESDLDIATSTASRKFKGLRTYVPEDSHIDVSDSSDFKAMYSDEFMCKVEFSKYKVPKKDISVIRYKHSHYRVASVDYVLSWKKQYAYEYNLAKHQRDLQEIVEKEDTGVFQKRKRPPKNRKVLTKKGSGQNRDDLPF